MKHVDFWFEFGSTYSYLSAMRLDAVADAHGVATTWKPFLLGPIFKSFGWETSPFKIYKQKGAYMWRDMERRAAKYGMPFQRLDKASGQVFPQNGVAAARLALIGLKTDWGKDFCRAVYYAEFAEGRDISGQELLFALARTAGAEQGEIDAAFCDETKAALRAQTERAISLGLFGAPSFVAGDELFWGDDRLEDAVIFAKEMDPAAP